MTHRKVIFWFWGLVYWPFFVVAMVFMVLFQIFGGIGGWLHDLLIGWAHPLPPAPKDLCYSCEIWPDSSCACRARKPEERRT